MPYVPESLAGQTVLVTGGAGFIGSHVARALAAETDVRVLDDLSTGSVDRVPEEATFVEGSVCDRRTVAAAIEGADVVFHQAANASVERSIEAPAESHETNVGGSIAVLEAARRADARVVSASSAAIYGPPERLPIAESHPKRPTSPYGVEKLALDRDTLVYSELYGLPTVSLRYFNVYGPGQGESDYGSVVDVFLDQARRGVPITVDGDGSQTRDFVHVRDVVRANLRAAVTDRVGTAFNVGSGGSTSIGTLAERVRAVTGSDSRIVHTDPRPGDIPRSRADISRARAKLGYDPQVSLDAGLETLVG